MYIPPAGRKKNSYQEPKLLHQIIVITPCEGIFIDGHERTDVVEAQTTFLRRMVKLGFHNLLHAPTDKYCAAIPTDIEQLTAEK